jgi:CrcB protein
MKCGLPTLAGTPLTSPVFSIWFSMEAILLDKYLMVLVGGGVGSLARYVLGVAISGRVGGRFPLGTLVINVTGCFLIGLLMTLFTERLQLDPDWRLLLVVGVLGGYTTFSTFEYETFRAVHDGGKWIGLLNVVGSVTLGYIAVWLGSAIVSRH